MCTLGAAIMKKTEALATAISYWQSDSANRSISEMKLPLTAGTAFGHEDGALGALGLGVAGVLHRVVAGVRSRARLVALWRLSAAGLRWW